VVKKAEVRGRVGKLEERRGRGWGGSTEKPNGKRKVI
jgi:hypothetical protein